MSSCTDCIEKTIPDCLAELVIQNAQIINYGSYRVEITDHFGNMEWHNVTAISGALVIDLDNFSDEFLNQFGKYIVKIYNNSTDVYLTFTVAELVYDCIYLNVQHTRPAESTWTIQIIED